MQNITGGELRQAVSTEFVETIKYKHDVSSLEQMIENQLWYVEIVIKMAY